MNGAECKFFVIQNSLSVNAKSVLSGDLEGYTTRLIQNEMTAFRMECDIDFLLFGSVRTFLLDTGISE